MIEFFPLFLNLSVLPEGQYYPSGHFRNKTCVTAGVVDLSPGHLAGYGCYRCPLRVTIKLPVFFQWVIACAVVLAFVAVVTLFDRIVVVADDFFSPPGSSLQPVSPIQVIGGNVNPSESGQHR